MHGLRVDRSLYRFVLSALAELILEFRSPALAGDGPHTFPKGDCGRWMHAPESILSCAIELGGSFPPDSLRSQPGPKADAHADCADLSIVPGAGQSRNTRHQTSVPLVETPMQHQQGLPVRREQHRIGEHLNALVTLWIIAAAHELRVILSERWSEGLGWAVSRLIGG